LQQIRYRRTSAIAAEAGARSAQLPTWVFGEQRLWRTAVAIVVALGLIRLLMAAYTPLVPDEAYYWEWSRRLAPGYFDHPPVIALLISAGTALFGPTPLGVRFFSVLAGITSMLLVVDLAKRHGGARAALYAAVISGCVPLAAAGLVLAAPDAPMLFAFALGISAVDRALAAPLRSPESLAWWLLAGLAAGLGMASKYPAVLLPLGVMLAFLLRPSLRRQLRTPGPYVACLVALVPFLPVLVWNAMHGWASFAFQLQHGLGGSGGSALMRQLDLLGNQLGIVSPLLFVLLTLAVGAALRPATPDRRYTIAMTAAITFGFFAYSALRQRVEPNWPAPAYLPGFVLLAILAAEGRWRGWVQAGCGLAAVMVALIYVQALVPVLPVPARKDPMARGYGWTTLAEAVDRARSPAAPGGVGVPWVAANRYQDAAQLAFHLPANPTVFSLNLASRRNQYDYWPGFPESARTGESLLLVLEDSDPAEQVIRLLRPHFRQARRGERVELRRGEGLLATRRVWHLEGWLGSWPEG
jgi:4-amino-4-deoxy-L-arabinose transferase-like glycosyltransferase